MALSRALVAVERLYWTARDLRENRFPLELLEDDKRELVYFDLHNTATQREKCVLQTDYYLRQFISNLYDDVSCAACGEDFFSSDSPDSEIVFEEVSENGGSGPYFWVPLTPQENTEDEEESVRGCLTVRCLNTRCAQRFVPLTFESERDNDNTALFCGACDVANATEGELMFQRVHFFDLDERQLAFLQVNEIGAKRFVANNVFARIVHARCNTRRRCDDFERRVSAMGLSSLVALFPQAKLVTCLLWKEGEDCLRESISNASKEFA